MRSPWGSNLAPLPLCLHTHPGDLKLPARNVMPTPDQTSHHHQVTYTSPLSQYTSHSHHQCDATHFVTLQFHLPPQVPQSSFVRDFIRSSLSSRPELLLKQLRYELSPNVLQGTDWRVPGQQLAKARWTKGTPPLLQKRRLRKTQQPRAATLHAPKSIGHSSRL